MATKAQINANRPAAPTRVRRRGGWQNAQKSTGPQTAEGKAVAAKNAVKHGLFACEDVITGEDPADYDDLHDAIIAELAPAGVLETILAERVVSLTWRLQRSVHMQTQALEVKLARDEPSPLQKQLTAMLPAHLRKVQDDPRGAGPDLILGRVVIKDYADARILERLSMYEKRIEGSLFRTIKELDRYRLIRQSESEKADKETAEYEKVYHPQPIRLSAQGSASLEDATQVLQDEDATPAESNAAKRSQSVARPSWPCFHGLEAHATFAQDKSVKTQDIRPKTHDSNSAKRTQLPDSTDVTSFIQKDYENQSHPEPSENKSNLHSLVRAEG